MTKLLGSFNYLQSSITFEANDEGTKFIITNKAGIAQQQLVGVDEFTDLYIAKDTFEKFVFYRFNVTGNDSISAYMQEQANKEAHPPLTLEYALSIMKEKQAVNETLLPEYIKHFDSIIIAELKEGNKTVDIYAAHCKVMGIDSRFKNMHVDRVIAHYKKLGFQIANTDGLTFICMNHIPVQQD